MGGGGGCVLTTAFVRSIRDGKEEVIRAGEVKVGDILVGADPITLEPTTHAVTYSQAKMQPCVELESVGGVVLPCSRSAPIPTTDGLTLAPDLEGR
jgi:hypothetical protein